MKYYCPLCELVSDVELGKLYGIVDERFWDEVGDPRAQLHKWRLPSIILELD